MDDIVVIAVDRSPGRVFKQAIAINEFPTLTTANDGLFLLSARDVYHRTTDHEREFFRKPRATERMTAQGFPPDVVLHVPSSQHMFAAGNAYPPPLITANLHPFLRSVGESSIGLETWPTRESLQEDGAALRAVYALSDMLEREEERAVAKPMPARKRPAAQIS